MKTHCGTYLLLSHCIHNNIDMFTSRVILVPLRQSFIDDNESNQRQSSTASRESSGSQGHKRAAAPLQLFLETKQGFESFKYVSSC